MGDLRDIEADDIPHSEYGLYIMPLPILFTGRLIAVTTNGFYNASVKTSAVRFVLFRKISDCSYCKAFYINFTPNATNGSVHQTITIPVNRRVMAGDMIGLQNSKDCELNLCLQPAIQSNSTNDTVLYSSMGKFSDLENRTGVYLNMEAIMGKMTCPCMVLCCCR